MVMITCNIKCCKRVGKKQLFVIAKSDPMYEKLLRVISKIKSKNYKVGGLFESKNKDCLFLSVLDNFNEYEKLTKNAVYSAQLYTKTNEATGYVNVRIKNESLNLLKKPNEYNENWLDL